MHSHLLLCLGLWATSVRALGPLHVGVLGAGMAGLYSAMLLQSLDISCEVLEAAPQPGGRVLAIPY